LGKCGGRFFTWRPPSTSGAETAKWD